MSNRDLVSELKNTIKDLTEEKEDLHRSILHKESRNKQILIRLEQANNELDHVGKHSSKVQKDADGIKKENSTLQAKLETTEELLKLAKEKLKDFEPDKEVNLTDEDIEHISDSEDSEDPALRSVVSEKYNKEE